MDSNAATERGIDWRDRRLVLLLAIPVAIYFAIIPIYALFHAELYAADIPRFLRYMLVPAAISAAMVIVALYVRRDYALITSLVVVALLAALFAFEAMLTVKALNASLGQVGHLKEGTEDPPDVRRSMPPAYTSKALNNELKVTSLNEAILGGLPQRKVLLCSRDGAPVTYEADRFGYNNPEKAYDGPVDVLVVGDSFIEGICLPPGEDIVSRIRSRMGGVVGMGTRGAGPLIELAALGRYGPVLKPRHTVIAFFAGNDWENLEKEKKKPWLQEALKEGADYGPPQPDPVTVERATQTVEEWWNKGDQNVGELFKRRAVLRNFFALQQTALNLGLHYPKASPEQPVFEEVLQRAVKLTGSWGGDLTLVYIPHVSMFFGGAADASYDDLREKVTSAAASAGVPVIDLQAEFSAHSDPLSFFAPDAHFSDAGAELAATVIAHNLNNSAGKALASRGRQ